MAIVSKDVPADKVQVLREAFDKTIQDKDFVNLINKIGEQVVYMSGADFEKDWKAQEGIYKNLLTDLGMAK